MDVRKNGYPVFWLAIRKGFSRRNINKSLKCPMNYLYNMQFKKYH